MKKMISCDWGTSTLRLRLVDMDKAAVLGELMNGEGISPTFHAWTNLSLMEADRLPFYLSVIKGPLSLLEEQVNYSLAGLPVVISGMASSNMGMLELPYKELPFSTNGHDLCCRFLPATALFDHRVLVISGGKTTLDVMRGEETQLIGCAPSDGVYIFPGTHSKHIWVNERSALSLKTYMTGEFFSLLSKNGILAGSVSEKGSLFDGSDLECFEAGVKEGAHSNLLHSAFLVRTNHLLGKYTKEENYYYLSGLLIGSEIKDLPGQGLPMTVVGNESQKGYYLTAFRTLGMFDVQFVDASDAVIKGQSKIYTYHEKAITA